MALGKLNEVMKQQGVRHVIRVFEMPGTEPMRVTPSLHREFEHPQCPHCWNPIRSLPDRGVLLIDGQGRETRLHTACFEQCRKEGLIEAEEETDHDPTPPGSNPPR